MTARRRGVGLTPMETRRDVIVRAAVLADELGYETFSVPEGWGLDSTPLLTEIALRTARIQVASGVLSVWGRTPATLAMTAATLHQVCGGRYVLGLGASTRALAEGFHDIPFERPAARLRDVVTKVRALLDGLPYGPGRRPGGAPAAPAPVARPPELPIWIAALGQHTMNVAAELADGWIPALMARDHVAAWAARLGQRRETAAPHAAAYGGGRSHRRRGRRPGAEGHRRGLRRLVPQRHGRRLCPLPGRPGLRRRGQRGDRGEPAAQPAARDDTPRGPGRPRPTRRLRNPRPAPRATRALGPGRRHRRRRSCCRPACPGV